MKREELIKKLLLFKDKAFCYYTWNKAESIWRNIKNEIPKEFLPKIEMAWGDICCENFGHSACNNLDREIKRLIDKL